MVKLPEMRCSTHHNKTLCAGTRNGLNSRVVYTHDGNSSKKVTVVIKISGYRCKLPNSHIAIVASNENPKYKLSTGKKDNHKSKTKNNKKRHTSATNQEHIRGFTRSKSAETEVVIRYEKVHGEKQPFWHNFREVESASVFHFQSECASSFGLQVIMVRRKGNESSSRISSAASPNIIASRMAVLISCCILGLVFVL